MPGDEAGIILAEIPEETAMIAMLFAVALQAAGPAAPVAMETPNRYQPTARCRMKQKTADDLPRRMQRLGELPEAHGEYAVNRRVDGCPVPTLMARRALLK